MPNLPFTMRFGTNGDYKLWATEGWYHDANEKEHVWAGHVAKLRLMLEYGKDDLLLRIDVVPVQAQGISQELFAFVNGRFAAFWSIKDPSERSALVEANFFVSGENLITFVSPKAVCPSELGIGKDQRTLGLAFRKFSLSAAP